MRSFRILLVHGQRTFLSALRHLLESEVDLEVVGAVPSTQAARAALDTLRPHGVIVGTDLDGPRDGIELAEILARDGDEAPALVVVGVDGNDVDAAIASVRAGAVVFVPHDAGAHELLEGIRAAARGEAWMPRALLAEVLRRLAASGGAGEPPAALAGLTDREREILELLVSGLDRVEIAERLHVSPNTVRTHVGNILRKLDVHSTLEAVALAYGHGVRGQVL
jgi:DNA-binding NarL/FixJ family response regulator